MDGIRMGHQLIEHFRPSRQLIIARPLFVQQSDGLTITALRVAIALHLPIEIAQFQQQDTFLRTAACSFLIARFISSYGTCRVVLGEIDVAYCVINLIKIILIIVRGRHALQSADHFLIIASRHHLCLGNAGIKLQLVRRILGGHTTIGLISLLRTSKAGEHLSHDKPLASLLRLAVFPAYHLPQIRHCLLQLTRAQVVVSHGLVPGRLGRIVDGVSILISDHVLGVIHPVQLTVTACQPGASHAVDGRLGLVQAAHVTKGGGSLVEGAFLKLRLPQHQPCLPKKGIILATRQPLNILLRLPAVFLPFWPGLDAMLLDGFLHLLHSAVEVAASQRAALLVGHGKQRQLAGIVVLVAPLLLQRSVDEGQLTIIISIIFSRKRLPEAALRSVLLHRA